MRSRFLFVVVVLAIACDDGGPSSPSLVTTTTSVPSLTLTVVSGETDGPVAGAAVTLAGVTAMTDGAGVVRLPTGGSAGAELDVVAPGFLHRQTLYRGPDETRFSLWPETSPTGLDPEITKRLVYTGFDPDEEPGTLGLIRPPLGETIHVFVPADLAADVRVERVVAGAVDAFVAATEGRVAIDIVTTEPTDGVVFRIGIDPDTTASTFAGTFGWTFDGFTIREARFVLRSVPDLIEDGRLMTHLLGHGFGLGHSPDESDRMFPDWWLRRRNDFSSKEALVMRLMLLRRPGNRFPDNDRRLGVAAIRPVRLVERDKGS